nr:MAG TPA: hypothetical protein [Caudoviricetes sp.]
MVYCQNRRCRHHPKGCCLNMRLVIDRERCISFEPKRKAKKKTQTDLNHEPVPNRKRNLILK